MLGGLWRLPYLRGATPLRCAKHCNVYFYGPRSSAKTHILGPIRQVFGPDAFLRPVGKCNFPLMNISGKKICLASRRDIDAVFRPAREGRRREAKGGGTKGRRRGKER